jgi:predicted RNase H-like HicB family nuclease/predicted RNA binding protein YcfA (HicA-like mRNA interferase family)
MSSADLISELKKAGWRLARVNGSHHVFTHPQRIGIVVVPHPQEGLGAWAGEGHTAAGRDLRRGYNMRYPVAIEPGTETEAFGVVVPDLPGCFSAGDTMEEAMAKAEESIAAWIETALDAGQDIPLPSSVEALRKKHKEWKTWVWAVVKVDPAVLDDTLERVNISLPRRVLHRLDALARATGETRSGFIARMALEGHHATT